MICLSFASLILYLFSHNEIRQYMTQRGRSGNGYRMPDKTFFGSVKDAFCICAFGMVFENFGAYWKTLSRMLMDSDAPKRVRVWMWIYCLSFFHFVFGLIGTVSLMAFIVG